MVIFKPYIPHIAFMYAAGLKESETIFCNVNFDHLHISKKTAKSNHGTLGKNQANAAILCQRIQLPQIAGPPGGSFIFSVVVHLLIALSFINLGCEVYQDHHMFTVLVPPAPWF